MMRSTFSVVIALLLAVSAAVATGGPISAVDPDDGSPSSPPARPAASPLLEALTFLPPANISFAFTDWTALKALHGGVDITSASPLEERQRLMLDIARSEWNTAPLGLDRLATWPQRWGWDNTDLAWEANSDAIYPGKVLRFRDDWDPTRFMARLEEYGYLRSDKPHGTSFTPGPGIGVPPGAGLERVLGFERQIQDQPYFGMPVSVAISPDGRTVAIVPGDMAHRVLKLALRADPGAVAASPIGRVGTALGRPLSANIVNGRYSCPSPGQAEEIDLLPAEAAALIRSVSPLHPYQAWGVGYQRAGPGEPAIGRYVFAYEKAKQAKADLPGRRTLIDQGYSLYHGKRYRDAAFRLVDAVADGRELILDVALVNDTPRTLFDLLISRSMSFATCG